MFGGGDVDPFESYLGRATVGLNELLGSLETEAAAEQFCTLDNLASSIQYINNTLDAFGFAPALPQPPPPSSSTSSASPSSSPSPPPLELAPSSAVQLVNTVYALLQQHQKEVEYRSESSDRVRRLQADKEAASAASRRWEERANAAEKEVNYMVAKERSREEATRKMKEKLEWEKEEKEKQIAALQHRDSQAQHEIRKKEREYVRLQERLQHMLNERNREVKAGMDMLQTIQREGKKRAGWKVQGGKNVEDEMYKMIISTYETKQQELVDENNDLRDSLRDLQAELQQLLNDHQPTRKHTQATTIISTPSKDNISSSPSMMTNDDKLLAGQFDLPFALACDTIKERLRAQMQQYREIVQLQATEETPAPTIETLQHQLDECKRIIEEQEKLVQFTLQSVSPSIPSHPSPSSHLSLPSTPSSSSFPSSSISASSSSPSSTSTSSSSLPSTAVPSFPTSAPSVNLDDSRVELATRVLEEERRLFEEQKEHFEEERKRVADAAVQLAKERMELQELKKLVSTGKPTPNLPNIIPPLCSDTPTKEDGLSMSFISELEQVSLQQSIDKFVKNEFVVPPSPILRKH